MSTASRKPRIPSRRRPGDAELVLLVELGPIVEQFVVELVIELRTIELVEQQRLLVQLRLAASAPGPAVRGGMRRASR